MQNPLIPQRAASDPEILPVARDGDRVRRLGLELNGVRTNLFRRLDKAHGLPEVLVVIGGELGDQIDGVALPMNRRPIGMAALISKHFCRIRNESQADYEQTPFRAFETLR